MDDPATTDDPAVLEASVPGDLLKTTNVPIVMLDIDSKFEPYADDTDAIAKVPDVTNAKAVGVTLDPNVTTEEIPRNITTDSFPSNASGCRSPKSVDSGRSGKSYKSVESGINNITGRQWAGYCWGRVKEHLISVGMISGYLLIFYVGFLWKLPPGTVFIGLACVCLGITFFMEGFMSGIMPIAELLGKGIPDKFNTPGAMLTTFLLGIACTLAEPAMGALELAGSMVKVDKAPILWYLLTKWNFYVFIAVGLGVGFAALIGTLRLMRRWNLKLLIFLSTMLSIGLTALADYQGLTEVVGLAWDAGAVTTGAVTVPIILGLGVGIMMTDRQNRGDEEEVNALDSFGIVTLASLYPVIFVLLLGYICDRTVTTEEIKAHAKVVELRKVTDQDTASIWDKSPLLEFVYATRAVVPLILLVVGLVKVFMRESLPYITLNIRDVKFSEVGQVGQGQTADHLRRPPEEGHVRVHVFLGVFQAYLGLIIFNVGLRHGQGPLGDQVGASVPGLYSQVDGISASPALPDRTSGYVVVCLFTFFMAFTATYAEPALNAMGMTTEQLTNGAFKKSVLLFAVAVGVGGGVMFGVLRMVFGWSLTIMLCISYPVALLLTFTSDIEYVSVGWDCAGVTTSSITVPLVLAMGMGLGTELGVQDSFGLLAMGSIGPILSVLVAGRLSKFWFYMKNRRSQKK